jgi:hypothetical protein
VQILAYLLARFSEPSSYAGIGALLALLGWHLSDPALGQLARLLAGGCALLALLLKERGLLRALVVVLALAPVLAACGMPQAPLGGSGAAGSFGAALDTIAAAVDPAIASACGEYADSKAVADRLLAAGALPSGVAGKVRSIESFGDAACAAPPAGDRQSTAIWLGRLAGQIGALAGAR